MKLGKEQVKEIAMEVETGMKVFINRSTLEFRSIPDVDDLSDYEFWEDEEEELESNEEDYITIETMSSGEGFEIMEDFVEEVTDAQLKKALIEALNRKRPFANFKAEVEASSHRQQWFDFRTKRYQEYVREALEDEGIEVEE